MPRVARLPDNLTHRERKFVRVLTKGDGVSPTEAALQVYNVKTRQSASAMATDIVHRPRVQDAIKKALKAQGLDLGQIASNLKSLANAKPDKMASETVLKANIEALKLMGEYPSEKHAHFNLNAKIESRSFKEARDELAKLRAETERLLADIS